MPRFTFHMVATDGSGHFQRGQILSASEEEARATLMRREYARCACQVSAEDLAELRAETGMSEDDLAKVLPKLLDPKNDLLETLKQNGIKLNGGLRFRLRCARQNEPYKIEWIVEGHNPGLKKRKAA